MDEASLSGIIKFWQNTGLYPFSPLEVNFFINFIWVIFSSTFRFSSDYRLKQKEEKTTQAPLTFLSFRLILFLFSFVGMVAIYLSFSFWLGFYGVRMGNFLWWLPSAISISLVEFSHWAAALVKEKEEEKGTTVGEEMMEKSSKELPIYFLTLFFGLGIFWLVLILNNKDKLGF